MPLTYGGYTPEGDPRNDPRYKALKKRQGEARQLFNARPLTVEEQRQVEKYGKETKRWRRRQAVDLPKWQAKERKKEERKAKLPHNKVKSLAQDKLDAKDKRGGQRAITKGKGNAKRGNDARVCTSCLGTGKKSTFLGSTKCGACNGTGQKPQSSWF
jgi:hypothetical protein